MGFEWNETKRLSNLDKHDIDFVDASEMFDGPMLVRQDVRKTYLQERQTNVNKNTLKMKSKTNWKKIDAKRDKDIDYSDIPEQGDDFFKNAILKMPQKKTIITIRIENDVLQWFKSKGRGYQTRIGALLRAYKEAHSKTQHNKA